LGLDGLDALPHGCLGLFLGGFFALCLLRFKRFNGGHVAGHSAIAGPGFAMQPVNFCSG
jgi:hypothetical protein